jgi:hypothetical protein
MYISGLSGLGVTRTEIQSSNPLIPKIQLDTHREPPFELVVPWVR